MFTRFSNDFIYAVNFATSCLCFTAITLLEPELGLLEVGDVAVGIAKGIVSNKLFGSASAGD